MSRIPTPAAIEDALAPSQPFLTAIKAKLGVAPNMYRLVGVSPAALEGLVNLTGALSKGAIGAATRERIALAVANINGCTYCNSAHTYLAKNVAKLDDAEIAANRVGGSTDPAADAAVKFAAQVARKRGQIADADIAAARAAGLSEAALIDIVGLVALNVFTNYINESFKTDLDFPVIEASRAA